MLCARWFGVALLCGLVAAGVKAEDRAEEDPAPVAAEPFVEATSVGEAVIETAAPDWHYPKAYAARPLTMNKFMIRGTMLVDVKRAVPNNTSGRATGAPLVSIDLGAAFAVSDKLEVGVSNYRLGSTPPNTGQGMFPIVVAPRGTFGDMPLYVRYSFLQKRYFEMALDFVLLLPTWTNMSVTAGLPMRLRVRDVFTVDTGAELVLLTNGAGLNAEVPLKATYSITPAGFIFADSGFSFQNVARNLTGGTYRDSNLAFPVARNQIFVPLGVGGGYTHVVRKIVMIDVFARFGWNPFVYVNPPSGTNTVPVADGWVLTVGAIIQTSPILHEGDL
ncbi:MAG: hypothetical protein KJO40_07605 [Deltaproteobacteria bacterium]|nr:hypothetical protein [Deltaproteobacteria bacterium]NND29754.1 hypothetical protein [Myxococcales bacterium]MBT8465572.1 hypothetical protein [Deltaproteobacteria bacterium]MBT8480162.1 hypothetical protein [Deltaproteobacteria bacterium]NNK09592.1 hypothetical protein [Myxococcales bacterium]